MESVILRDSSSGRYHLATLDADGNPMVHDADNIKGERTYVDALPPGVDDALLCKRCFHPEPPTLNTRSEAP